MRKNDIMEWKTQGALTHSTKHNHNKCNQSREFNTRLMMLLSSVRWNALRIDESIYDWNKLLLFFLRIYLHDNTMVCGDNSLKLNQLL